MTTTYSGWARVELMGHRVRHGLISEAEQFGTKMLRIDIPNPAAADEPVTEFYGGAAIYAITPVTEEIVRDWVGTSDIRPAKPMRYQLPQSEPDDDGPSF